MKAYADAVRRLLVSDPSEPAERFRLARAVLETAPDDRCTAEAYRLTQEAFDINPSAFRYRVYRLWAALPVSYRPEITATQDEAQSRPVAAQAVPDPIGLTPHIHQRRQAHN